jgi:hypothetical protein
MTDPFTDTVRLRSPADLLAMVPYMLGFHPADSLVAVAIRDKRPVLNARVDLPDAGAPLRNIRAMWRYVRQMVVERDPDAVLLIGYGEAARVTPVLDRAVEVLGRRVPILDMLRVTDGRYWSLFCRDDTCCPPEGTPFEVAASPIAAAATLAGMVALPDRETLVGQVDPAPEDELAAMREAVSRADERLLDLAETAELTSDPIEVLVAAGELALDDAIRRHEAGQALPDDELAWLCVLAGLMPVNERLSDATDEAPAHRAIWLTALRKAPYDLVPPVGCLVAYTAWRDGDGALANAALERVLEVEPDFPPALAIQEALTSGQPPTATLIAHY